MKRATGDRLSDTAKIGLLVAITSGKLHEHLLLYVSEASTYEQIRYRILNYVKSKRINNNSQSIQLHLGPCLWKSMLSAHKALRNEHMANHQKENATNIALVATNQVTGILSVGTTQEEITTTRARLESKKVARTTTAARRAKAITTTRASRTRRAITTKARRAPAELRLE